MLGCWIAGSCRAEPEVRLSPRVRAEPPGEPARCAVAGSEPSVPGPLLLDVAMPDTAAHIVALADGRRYIGTGGLAYVTGLDPAQARRGSVWDAFARPEPLRAAGGTVFGYQAAYLGTLRLVSAQPAVGETATLQVLRAVREIGAGAVVLPRAAAQAARPWPVPDAPANHAAVPPAIR